MGKYIMALDQGTTSSRCILFNRQGQICSMAQKEFSQYYPKPGWVEHDPMEIWSSQLAVSIEAISKIGASAKDIAGIGITNQRETTIVWDRRTGVPVYPAIVWQCRRTAERIERLSTDLLCNVDGRYATDLQKTAVVQKETDSGTGTVAAQQPETDVQQADAVQKAASEQRPAFADHSICMSDYVHKVTGLIPDAYFSASKIEWILDHVEGARAEARAGHLLFGTVDTWLIWKLSGGTVHVTDYTNASRTMLFDIHNLCWDETLLSYFHIPKEMLPEVKPSSCLYGYTDAGILGAQIPIAGAAGDQQAALFGQCCFEPGEVKNTYGTGCFLLMNTGTQAVTSENGLLTTIAASVETDCDKPDSVTTADSLGKHANSTADSWSKGAESTADSLKKNAEDSNLLCRNADDGDSNNLNRRKKVQYALEGSIFVAGAGIQWLRDEMHLIDDAAASEQAACSVPDTGGVYMVPAFTGMGAPYWNPYAKGTVVGLTRGCSKAHFIRAVLESMAYQTVDILKLMESESGTPIRALRVDGGASRNNFLMQFQADVLAVDVLRPSCVETTALGAAYLAGLAVGYWADTEEIRRNWALADTFSPAMSEERRSELLKGWARAVRCALAWAEE